MTRRHMGSEHMASSTSFLSSLYHSEMSSQRWVSHSARHDWCHVERHVENATSSSCPQLRLIISVPSLKPWGSLCLLHLKIPILTLISLWGEGTLEPFLHCLAMASKPYRQHKPEWDVTLSEGGFYLGSKDWGGGCGGWSHGWFHSKGTPLHYFAWFFG